MCSSDLNNNDLYLRNNDNWYIIYNNLYRFNYNNNYLVYSTLPYDNYYDITIIDKDVDAGNNKFQGFYTTSQADEQQDEPGTMRMNNENKETLKVKVLYSILDEEPDLLSLILRDIKYCKTSRIVNIYDVLLSGNYNYDLPLTYTIMLDNINNVIFNKLKYNTITGFLYLTNDGNNEPKLLLFDSLNGVGDYNFTKIQYNDNVFVGEIVDINIDKLDSSDYDNGYVIYNQRDNKFYINVVTNEDDFGLIPTLINNTLVYINECGDINEIKTDRVLYQKSSIDLFNGYYNKTSNNNPDLYQLLQDSKDTIYSGKEKPKEGDYLLLSTYDNNIIISIKVYKYINDIGNNGFVNILFDSGFFYYSRNYIDKLFNVLLFVIDNNIIEYTDYEYYYNEIINNGFVGEKGDNVEYYYNTYQSNSKMYLDNNGKLFTYNDGDSNYYPTITGLNKFNFNCVDENDVIIAKYVVYIPSNLVDNVEIIEVKFTKDLYDSYNGYCSYLLINQYPINDNDLYNSISDIESFFGFSLLARSSSDGFVKIYTITDVENKIININELTNEYIIFTNYYNLEILKVNRFGFDPNLINGVLFDKISIDKENSSLLNIPFNGLILYTDIPGPAPVPPAPSYHPAANPAANQEDPGEYPSNKYLKPDNDEGVNNNYCIFNNNTMCFKNNNVWYLIFNNLYRFNYNTQNEQYLVYSSLPEGLNYDLVLIDKNINSGDSKFQGYLYEKTGKIFHQPLTSSILFTLLRDIRDIKKNKVLNIYDIYLK